MCPQPLDFRVWPQDLPQPIRPYGAYCLHGLARWGDRLLALDRTQGYLLQVDLSSENTQILNATHTHFFMGANSVAIWEDTLWFTQDDSVYRCSVQDFRPQKVLSLPYRVNGVAVWQSTLYVSSQRAGYIFVFDGETGRQITKFITPGVGIENLSVRDEQLWVCDTIEQTVYCLDRGTGVQEFSVLTPFEVPTGLAFFPHPVTGEDTLYLTYASEEAYIRDNPNAEPPLELTYRDRTFIHPLYFRHYPDQRYALSNGYLIEMSYLEELEPLEEVYLENLEWRIALPTETDRQKVLAVEPIGLPFTEELQEGQRVAVFKFDVLKPGERHVFGWKAWVEVWSIKYLIKPRHVENLPEMPPEIQSRYLVDNDNLAMDTPIILEAAREAVGTETNLLRKTLKIRNYVYDRLSYGIKPHIDTPDVALDRGVGSCGEYLGVLLALSRLNGIACRTVGRYKCPSQADKPFLPLQPEFNHVWMEFYVPGLGWLPMESNPDDVSERGPYPTRFFMGLAWYHMELGKGISFENLQVNQRPVNKEEISIGNLAVNHIRFRILKELKPS